jgi:CheY-like chemotaxis protein
MNKILFVGEKETFVIRVLMKKINAPMTEVEFVKCDAVTLEAAMTGDYLIVLYIDDDTKIGDDVVHLLEDHMREEAGGIIVIGEPAHISSIKRHMSEGFIYKEFTRPVNNEEFVQAALDYFDEEKREDLKKRILIIDDDPQYLSLIRGWLKDTYKISVANSGLQGIKYLGKNKVDLILLDYEMPITSGPQVLEMLRGDKDTKDIPVIFLTGKSDKNSVMAVVELRPEGYLLKSIQKEELTLKLEEYFAKSK